MSLNWYFKPKLPINASWQLIGSGNSIEAPNQTGTLEFILSVPCLSEKKKKSIPIYERPQCAGLICGNSFKPDVTGVNNVFRILEYGAQAPNIGEGPAYGIIDFELKIWNRWGNLIRTVSKEDIGRLPNDILRQGDIFWDGRQDSGEKVSSGSYTFQLWIKKCGQTNFVLSSIPTGAGISNCIRYNIFGKCVESFPNGGWGAVVNVIR